MIRQIMCLFILLSPVLTPAQGIKFQHGLSWEQVKQKAKQENKFVFIDCYASWCLPCKKMEKEVFPLKNVGDYMNEHFISIRVQMDTTKNDGAFIQSWYHDASEIMHQYKVDTYPSYLFFSPDGKIAHRYLSYWPDSAFLKIAMDAIDPEKQYYSLLDRYSNKMIDKSRLGYRATLTKQIGQDSLAKIIAKDYLTNYLNKLQEKDLLQKKHFDFLSTFPSILSSSDNVFKYMYRNESKVDELINRKGFAQAIIGGTIKRENITPKLKMVSKPSEEPSWTAIASLIQKKYNKWWADKLILDAQLGWYQQKKDTSQIIKYTVKRYDRYGLDTAGVSWAYLNNFIFSYVFTFCNNSDTLAKAAKWMEMIIKNHPDDQGIIDTYANLLYKLGRKEEAIKWEEKASVFENESAIKEKRNVDQTYQQTLDKMKKGFPTWTENKSISFEKPPITPDVFGKFASAYASLSNDGNYAICFENGYTIKALNGNWQSGRLPSAEFSNNSRYCIYKTATDTLAFFDLRNKNTEYIPDVANYKQAGNCIGYLLKSDNRLIVRNLESKKEATFNEVNEYYFNESGSALIISINNKGLRALYMLNLDNKNKFTIWADEGNDDKPGGFIFSKAGNVFAFVLTGKSRKSIWYYKEGMDQAVEVANDQSLSTKDLLIDGISPRGFTSDGERLFIVLKEKEKPTPVNGVDVWSYTDAKLQSEQLNELTPANYLSLLDILTKTVLTLEQKDRRVIAINDKNALVANVPGPGMYDDSYWNRTTTSSVCLMSLTDSVNKLIDGGLPYSIASNYKFSYGGKFVLYYNAEQKNYFSYEIETDIKRNITASIKTTWTTYVKRDVPMAAYWPIGFAGSVANNDAVLIYDQSDIYQVDPSGKIAPINLTNDYGRKHNIEFRLLDNKNPFEDKEAVVISGFKRRNKDDGFYKITIGESKTPELLTSQPYMFTGTSEADIFYVRTPPIKAKNADVYLVRRMSASEAPNYFWTKDFKTFERITDVQPQKNYNWLTSELVRWKTLDGDFSQGILYKPENFDSAKKYPLIFYYYENLSEGLHGFLQPELTSGQLNIPYYVSNGYLVFTPDMHYKIGHTGQSVVNTVVSAARYLSNLSFVDVKHMGLQGHSRGGWETNFIITHTNLFAAAMSASGFCNYTNLYNGVRLQTSGVSKQVAFEKMYQRIGGTLWEKPELAIENSPIFKADKVNTPVLMMSNKEDDDIPFEQGVQFFTALRRLGKRVWMLQYDDGGHLVLGKSAEDLEIRMKQFFDHYLKDSACPRWMLYGVAASEKGNPDALKLVYEKDKDGKWLTPREGGLLNDEEKKKVEALKHRKPVTITID